MNFKNMLAAATIAASLLIGTASASPILWVGDSSGRLGQVDVATGNVTLVGNMGSVMTDIAFDSSGNLFGITFGSLYSINTATAASTFIGNHALGGSKNSLVFGSDDTLYAANTSLYSLNIGTGASTLIGNGGTSYSSSGDLAFIGDDLFLSSTGGVGGDKLVELNENNGTGTNVGNIGLFSVFGLATDNNIDLYGVAGVSVYNIDTGNGAATLLTSFNGQGLVGAFGSAFFEESGAMSPVPVPAAVWLFGTALIGFIGFSRRRKIA
jgi:hypothetical protein